MNEYSITITSRFRGDTVSTTFTTNAKTLVDATVDAAFCVRRVGLSVDEVVSVSVELITPAAVCAIMLVA